MLFGLMHLYRPFRIENLREVLEGFHKALLPSRILYASFKYGTSKTD